MIIDDRLLLIDYPACPGSFALLFLIQGGIESTRHIFKNCQGAFLILARIRSHLQLSMAG